MKNLSALRFFVLSSLILILAGCQSGPGPMGQSGSGPLLTENLPPQASGLPEDNKNAVKVAMLLPMSGRYSQIGNSLFNAAQLSLFENAPDQIQLEVEDTKGSPEIAVQAAEKALKEGANVIVGPLFANETAAVAGIAARYNVPVLTFSNDMRVAGNNVYLLGFMPDQQIIRLLDVAQSHGIRNMGVLVPRNPYGQLVKQIVLNSGPQIGVNIKFIEEYEPGTTNLSTEATRITSEGVDAVLIPEGGAQLKLMTSSLLYHNVNPGKVRFLGTGQWDSPETYQDNTLAGSWFVSAPIAERQKFMATYQRNYGQQPPRLATLAYDAISMISLLTRFYRDNGKFPTAMITQSRGYDGVDGIFRLNTNGTVERGLAVYEITPMSNVSVISPAPTAF